MRDAENPEQKAKRLAERFLVENGYTEQPPVLDKVVPESIERGVEQRRNTLQPKAYGVVFHRRTGPGWTVVFQYSPSMKEDPKAGRAVTMDDAFGDIRMEHKDYSLEAVDKKF